jgi:exosortase A-associated hydrolase 1
MNGFEETAIVFDSGGLKLLGIVARPREVFRVGVVIVVGGPQYRAGSHRQFTLLCRRLAEQGIASLRFDYHGLGDSEGPPALGVDAIEGDIHRAIDAFVAAAPEVREIVLWGLCGAASAAALYCPRDRRVTGVVMLNPWVRTDEGVARTRLRFYYLRRLINPAFWRRLLGGKVVVAESIRSLARDVEAAGRGSAPGAGAASGVAADAPGSLPQRMLAALERAKPRVLVILSGGEDLTANEFRQLVADSPGWRRLLASARVSRADVADANHTFSSARWRAEVEDLTLRWVRAAG